VPVKLLPARLTAPIPRGPNSSVSTGTAISSSTAITELTGLELTNLAIPRRDSFYVATSRIGLIMIVLGIILLLIGYFTGISILYTIGGILVVIGVVLWILGAVGRPIGGRKVWF
jgi:hypothetical protein